MKNSIKTKSDFWCIHNCSEQKRTKMLTAILVKHHGNYSPLTCVVASKKRVSKSAVLRNRAKRRVRTLIQKHPEFLENGDMLMVLTTKAVCTVPYKELEVDFCYAMKGVIKEWER